MILPHDRLATSHMTEKKAKENVGQKEQTTTTTMSTLLMSKKPLSKEGHREQLLDVFINTGGILVLLYCLNKYSVFPIIYGNVEQS